AMLLRTFGFVVFFFSGGRRHTRSTRAWSSDVCSSDLAVLLGAFLLYGITPGPLLFDDEPRLVWGLLVSFLIGHLLLLVLNLPLAPVFAQLLRLPYSYLYPLIIFTALIGAFAVANNTFSLWVVVVFGVVGFLTKRINFPIAPLVL